MQSLGIVWQYALLQCTLSKPTSQKIIIDFLTCNLSIITVYSGYTD